jgi:uncharacterized protein with HXXEE motif
MFSRAFADRIAFRFWLLALAQSAHSIEEMRAGLYDFMWEATPRLGLPRMGMTATTFAVINMGIIALLLGLAPFISAHRPWSAVAAWIVSVVEVANGVWHLAGTALFRRYVPGAGTAPLLIAAGIALIAALLRRRRDVRETLNARIAPAGRQDQGPRTKD